MGSLCGNHCSKYFKRTYFLFNLCKVFFCSLAEASAISPGLLTWASGDLGWAQLVGSTSGYRSFRWLNHTLLALAGWSGYVLMAMAEVQEVSFACITCLIVLKSHGQAQISRVREKHSAVLVVETAVIKRGVNKGRSRANYLSHMENNPDTFSY